MGPVARFLPVTMFTAFQGAPFRSRLFRVKGGRCCTDFEMARRKVWGAGLLVVTFAERIEGLLDQANPEDRSMLNIGVFACREDLIKHSDALQKLIDFRQPKSMRSKVAFQNAFFAFDTENSQRLSLGSTKAKRETLGHR